MLRMFFFSGTGNARNVAHWIAAAWREQDRAAEVIDLAKVEARAVHLDPGDEVGIASPTHGFNFPPITLRFFFAFPRARSANCAFIVNTRAGVRFFGVCLPGLSGVAQLLAALVLLLKGYRVVGMRPIDLPSNWISIHPGLREDNIRAIYERCEVITRRFAERLLDGRRDLRALWDLPQDLLIAPISLGYYFIGRFFFAKSFVASRACDGCEVCVRQCPTRALRLVGGRPFWTWRCESCMRCMNQCPRRAIETAHGFIVAVPLLLSLVMTALVVPAVRPLSPVWATGHPGELARFVFDNILALAVLFLAYRLMHRALRLRLVERLVVATSLTHFGFWRRYRAPRKSATASLPDRGESAAENTENADRCDARAEETR
jgi:ferredoxin